MPSPDYHPQHSSSSLNIWDWVGIALTLGWMLWFFCIPKEYSFHSEGLFSAFGWWMQGMVGRGRFSEISLIPVVSLYLLYRVWRRRHEIELHKSWHGLWMLVLGALFALSAIRTHQPRIALAALSTMLTGLTWYYWGFRCALRCVFPLFFILLWAVPPTLEQSTVPLQIMSTKLASWGASVFGVETIAEGTNISSVSGKWDSFNIAGGCSGLNSLKTLFLISLPWAYLADNLKFWKRIVLVLCSFPLAVFSNSFRIASIFILAEYVSPAFAGKTWHDWSGLILFFPASLLGLFIIHSLLSGEISLLKRRRTVICTTTHTHAQDS